MNSADPVMGGPGIVPKTLPSNALVPELDHQLPRGSTPILIRVLDRRDNRPRVRALHGDVRSHHRLWTEAAGRRRKRARRATAKKGTLARQFDQFYTSDAIAARYLRRLAKRYNLAAYLLVEPSAGGGAFSRQMPVNTVAIDRYPRCPGSLNADFLAFRLVCDLRTMTVGNPPFGRNACLAVDFFNHAAAQSDVIAMIFPRSFLKTAIENQLDRNFHRVHSEEVPPNSFELDGEPRDVGAIFQIWERRSAPRRLRLEELAHPDFEFSGPTDYDFLIRRVGANAGKISHGPGAHEDSHYFIKGNVEHIMRQLDLVGAARKATSTPSLAKSEIVRLYRRYVEGTRKPRRQR